MDNKDIPKETLAMIRVFLNIFLSDIADPKGKGIKATLEELASMEGINDTELISLMRIRADNMVGKCKINYKGTPYNFAKDTENRYYLEKVGPYDIIPDREKKN